MIQSLNTVNKIQFKDNNIIRLSTTYIPNYTGLCDRSFFSDNPYDKIGKFGAIVFDEKYLEEILTATEPDLVFFELKGLRTTTDVSMISQEIYFDISFMGTYIQNRDNIGKIEKLFKGTILTAYMVIDDENENDMTICFVVDDIVKSRNKKIMKLIK